MIIKAIMYIKLKLKINTKMLREKNLKIKERKTINTLMILEPPI